MFLRVYTMSDLYRKKHLSGQKGSARRDQAGIGVRLELKLIQRRAVDCGISKSRSHSHCPGDTPKAQEGNELVQLEVSVVVQVLVHAPI